ncbi:unnamed protein product [Ceratitis capitata]|uniref:(Mediterranean fruit fly) hypothetical protein n=1 Tax=Ceratitis capitata TaxID=7213 RepID=A0A811U2D6_CERCA|nr:unnamed protein product [Ceratitis capitata]
MLCCAFTACCIPSDFWNDFSSEFFVWNFLIRTIRQPEVIVCTYVHVCVCVCLCMCVCECINICKSIPGNCNKCNRSHFGLNNCIVLLLNVHHAQRDRGAHEGVTLGVERWKLLWRQTGGSTVQWRSTGIAVM